MDNSNEIYKVCVMHMAQLYGNREKIKKSDLMIRHQVSTSKQYSCEKMVGLFIIRSMKEMTNFSKNDIVQILRLGAAQKGSIICTMYILKVGYGKVDQTNALNNLHSRKLCIL